MYKCAKSYGGPWYGVIDRYLGVEFQKNGKTHYGWARLSVEVSRKPFKATAILTGFAYESIAGKSIKAGQTKGADDVVERPDARLAAPTGKPATLGMLALGERGLSIWRRKEHE